VKWYLDFQERSRLYLRDRVYNNGLRLPDSRPVVCANRHQCEPASGKILLVTDALVGCDHYVEIGLLSHSEEFPVGQFGPTTFIRRLDVMPDQPVPQRHGRIVLEEYTHGAALGRDRISQAAASVLQYDVHLFP